MDIPEPFAGTTPSWQKPFYFYDIQNGLLDKGVVLFEEIGVQNHQSSNHLR